MYKAIRKLRLGGIVPTNRSKSSNCIATKDNTESSNQSVRKAAIHLDGSLSMSIYKFYSFYFYDKI